MRAVSVVALVAAAGSAAALPMSGSYGSSSGTPTSSSASSSATPAGYSGSSSSASGNATESKALAASAPAIDDPVILQFALTLEHLESTFYRQGLQNFSQADFAAAGFDETFFKGMKSVAEDEATHVEFLTKALTAAGQQPVQECQYSFPVTDVKSFVTVSGILEGVGTTAYLGAAASISDKTTLTAAGSILTVEARHSSIIRSGLKQDPIAQPFDVPLTPNEVFTLAAPFIVSCPPGNVQLPLKPFPSLAVDPNQALPILENQTVTIQTPGYSLKPVDGVSPVFAAWITVTGPIFVKTEPVEGGFKVPVPQGVNGQSYVVLTGDNTNVTDATVAAGPAIVQLG
ncbi:MAG: hypothetical protein M1832_002429 [Thelocarpon impressellum]|nr:MAG: hypothetical protein M1832_002429 [Thelocarpon impressellum]